jgi:hypothetical protein
MHTARSRLALAALLLLAAGQSGTASAQTKPVAAEPSQQLAALLNAHEAFAAPNPAAKRLGLVQAQRPLTGEQTVLPVLAQATGRKKRRSLQARLPGRPNGHTGWIQRPGTRAGTTPWRILVDTETRQVSLYEDGRRVQTFDAVVGKPSTPTPYGHLFVEEAIQLALNAVGAPFRTRTQRPLRRSPDFRRRPRSDRPRRTRQRRWHARHRCFPRLRPPRRRHHALAHHPHRTRRPGQHHRLSDSRRRRRKPRLVFLIINGRRGRVVGRVCGTPWTLRNAVWRSESVCLR